jgi:hypothetical protein
MTVPTQLGCTPAMRERIQAFHHNDTLAIVAEGKVPSACYEVTIDAWRPDSGPLQFSLTQRRKSGLFCALEVGDYAVTQPFPIGPYQRNIVVYHRDGFDEVEVRRVAEYSLDAKVTLSRGRAIPIPFILPPSEGNRDEQVREGVVTGYSSRLSLDEALRDAIVRLEKNHDWNPDDLPFVVRVDGIFGEFGGFVGYRRLCVRIRAEYI